MRKLVTIPLALWAAPTFAQSAEPAPAPSPTASAEPPGTEVEAPAQGVPIISGRTETDDELKTDIVVTAPILKGQVDTVEAPIATLNEADIQATGAGSVSELLSRISPQTGSGRGRGGGGGQPVVLVNGQRVTNFRELRNFPPEAIRRVEILPESVALKYGFPPDTRVVNLILKPKFRSKSIEASYGRPTLGGFDTWALESSLTRIDGPARLSLTASTDDTSPLFESERGVKQQIPALPTVATDPQTAQFRTLIGDSRNFGLNAAWTRGIGKDGMGGSLSLSGSASRADSHSFQGLDAVVLTDPGGASVLRTLPGPLERASHVSTLQAGAGYNTFLGTWQLNTTVDGSHTETRSQFDRRADITSLVTAAAAGTLPITGPLPALPDAGFDTTSSTINSLTSLATLIGRPLRLPAGSASMTLKAGYAWSGIDSSDSRSTTGPVSLTRGDLVFGTNLSLPITSRREHFGQGVGDLTLNLSGGWDSLSDFGSLFDWSAGLTWAPTAKLSLGASYIVNQAAPSLGQLGNPMAITLNVPVYDFTRNETALVEITTGGNPALVKEQQRDLKFSANWQLPFISNSNVIVEYFRNRSDNVSASFPILTPDIEAAFPGRVTRDASGRLIKIDQRPITFARQDGSRLRWGINTSGGFGTADPNAGGGGIPGLGGGGGRPPGGGPRGGGGGGRGGGAGRGGGGGVGGMMGGPGGQPGRWSLGLYDTIQFQSRVLVAPGGPVLDLLDGDALSGGGTPRHTVEFNGGVFYKGLGTFFQGTWSSPTTLRASGLPGTSDLHFGSVANINMFLFFDFNQRPKLIKDVPFLKGARLTLRIENLLGARQRVTDANGMVPLSYQPDYLDPRGRVITLQLRKSF
jgi:outer membrane receptor protein involved in Fe transport